MKKITVLIIIGFVLAMLTACSSSVNDSHKKETGTDQSETTSSPFEPEEITSEEKNTEIMDEEPEDIKIAVVYFSGTGNTKAIAEMIADEAGADIYEIVPAQTYTDEDLNYNDDRLLSNLKVIDRDVIKYIMEFCLQIWKGKCEQQPVAFHRCVM